ncbi:hypothetical protein EV383_1472 [Pseudonocardia sediminis]|uniref:Uncharacterized protein n=1 Tax=Pseudonocardia sediminis TaxID=1397368 RepID=A0A4Q7UUX0_PSEST|nr:hypothetical protein [Pseudonocardia sediminis]RZT84621.1 hypothetical protein EV383_1472 [Pseudonocardia sediminis]
MTIRLDDATERDDLGAFTARVVRLDQTASMQLRSAGGFVTAWAHTPFDVLVTRSVAGSMEPAQRAVLASSLLTSLAVDRSESVDPGPAAGPWAEELPPDGGWSVVDDIPAGELDSLAERGIALAREHAGPMGPPASLLDQTVLTVSPPSGDAGKAVRAVKVQMRVLFAMSGMGFLGDSGTSGQEPVVRVSATGSWVRLDARYGAVVRRRLTSLPLLTV